jgi:hypothetical protein
MVYCEVPGQVAQPGCAPPTRSSPWLSSGHTATSEELAGEGPPGPGLCARPPGGPDTSGGCNCRDHCAGDRDTLARSKGSVSIIP